MVDTGTPSISFKESISSLFKTRVSDFDKALSLSLTHNYTHSARAWRLLSVGCFAEARAVSGEEKDILCLAASHVMSGNAADAVITLEAYVVALCVVEYEKQTRSEPFSEKQHLRRLGKIIRRWTMGRSVGLKTIGKSAKVTEKECHATLLNVCSMVDWNAIHRWFIIALFLWDAAPYTPPNLMWFYHFFSLFRTEDMLSEASQDSLNVSRSSRGVPAKCELNGDDVLSVLLSHCDRGELNLISAIVAWRTRRYRTAIAAATDFLDVDPTGLKTTNGPMRTLVRFIRCMSLVEISERTIASRDAVELMRDEDELTAAVGMAIAAFLIPLPRAVPFVTSYAGTIGERRHVYALCEYVHALTLVQLGSMQAAVRILRAAIPLVLKTDVVEWFLDLLMIACTSLEDSSTILQITMTPQRQLYIAMCPVFFGGFVDDALKLRPNSSAGRLLYRHYFPACASVRESLVFHMNYAHHLMARRKYIKAWGHVCTAAGCAEEIVGSVEFAFTDCSPLRVYYFGCRVGAEVLEVLLELMDMRNHAGKDPRFDQELTQEVFAEGDDLGEEVIRQCSHWARRIRQFHPNVRLGDIALSESSSLSHEANFLDRAITLAWSYPNCVLAQNCLTLALYMNNQIPEAVDHARKSLQSFPHSHEVSDLYRRILRKDGVYTFNYRSLVPVRYVPCRNIVWTKRTLFMLLLLLFHALLFTLITVVNFTAWVTLSEKFKEFAVRVQLPYVFPVFYGMLIVVYAVLSAVSKQNLVRTILQDLFFSDTWMNRFFFPLRGLALLNVVNAMQITIAGNNFLFDSHWSTLLLYICLLFLTVPFTSRLWFLPSLNEPKESFCTWGTILCVDILATLFLVVPHALLMAVEPIMFVVFFFYGASERLHLYNNDKGRWHATKRLRMHEKYLKKMPSAYAEESGSQFVHVRLLSFLYYKTHPTYAKAHLVKAQLDEDNYRVFPLAEVYERISTKPVPWSEEASSLVPSRRASAAGADFAAAPLTSGRRQAHDCGDTWDQWRQDVNGDVNGGGDGGGAEGRRETLSGGMSLLGANMNENVTADVSQNAGERPSGGDLSVLSVTESKFMNSSSSSASKGSEGEGGEGEEEKEMGEEHQTSSPPLSARRGAMEAAGVAEPAAGETKTLRGSEEEEEEEDAASISFFRDMEGGLETQMTTRPTARRRLIDLADTFVSSNVFYLKTGSNDSEHNGEDAPAESSEPKRGEGAGDLVIPGAALSSSFTPPPVEQISTSKPGVNCDSFKEAEKSLYDALQSLYAALCSVSNRKALLGECILMQEKKGTVSERLTSLYHLHGSEPFKLQDANCLDVCCMVVVKIIECGDNEENPLSAGNTALVEKMLQWLDTPNVVETILQHDLLSLCVIDGYVEMFFVIMTPKCVQRMELHHWRNLMHSFESTRASLKMDSLFVLFNAFQHIKTVSLVVDISPLFQHVLRLILLSEASAMSEKALDEFLRRLEREDCVKVDCWMTEGGDGQTIFSEACAKGTLKLVDALWRAGLVADVNRVQSDGTTALMQAVMNGQTHVARWFCELAPEITEKSFRHKHPRFGDLLDVAGQGMLRAVLAEAMKRYE